MKLQITAVTVKLEDDEFDSIIDTAGYGIAYWVPVAEVTDDSYIVHVEADELQGDLTHLNILDTYDRPHDWPVSGSTQYTRVELTKRDFERAIRRVITGDFPISQQIRAWVTEGDLGMYDSTVCDVLVQACLFKELVFG